MGSWTITTTAAEDEAIQYSYEQSQKPGLPGTAAMPPPGTALMSESRATETPEVYFDRRTHESTIGPMVAMHKTAKNTELVSSLSTIPPENRDAAQKDLEDLVVKHGGTVELSTVRYKWSKNTAAPPSANSVELDKTDANVATITKFTAHYLDADAKDRMTQLLAVAANTPIRVEDPANVATFVQLVTSGPPIQRQGANGYVEFPVTYSAHSGLLAPLDGLPVNVSFG